MSSETKSECILTELSHKRKPKTQCDDEAKGARWRIMLNRKEQLILSNLLELFLAVAWRQTGNNFFLFVLAALSVRHQLRKQNGKSLNFVV